MKQKVVIKVSMNDQKSRSKAMKIAVGVSGVESAALQGETKNLLEVVGDVDAVVLTTLIRKNVGYAELVTVSAVGEKKEQKKESGEKKAEATVQVPLAWSYPYTMPTYPIYEVRDPSYDNSGCTVM